MVDEIPAPLPAPACVDAAAVKLTLGIADADDDDVLAPVVAAVDLVVRSLPVADKARGLEAWPANVTHGATMLAARLYRRKGSPEGVAAFGADGPVYIQRNDPDVAMLLELGAWAGPAVG